MHQNGVIHRDLKVIFDLYSLLTFYLSRTVLSKLLTSVLPMRKRISLIQKLLNKLLNIEKCLRKDKVKE